MELSNNPRTTTNGLTERGCSSDLELTVAAKCLNRTTDDCLRCKGSVEITDDTGCNNMMIPSHRALCVQCLGTLTDECGSNAMFYPVVCPIYEKDDKCFTRKQIKKNELRRGCLSSAGELCPNATYCLTCSGHGCNNKDASSEEIPDAPGLAALTSIYGTLLFCMIALVLKI